MDFDGHDEKSERNRAARGFGFDFAARIFLGRPHLAIDDRRDYGEVRIDAPGEIDGDLDNVTFTGRGSVRSIISARRATRRERKLWHASV